jgi:FdhE protein
LAEVQILINKATKLFNALHQLQERFYPEDALVHSNFSPGELGRHYEEGVPLACLRPPYMEMEATAALQEQIAILVGEQRPDQGPAIKAVVQHLTSHPEVFNSYLGADIDTESEDAVSEEKVTADKNLLNFFIMQTMRPFMQRYAAGLQDILAEGAEQWLRPHCPVCGSQANISYLRAVDGKRVMVCPLCSTEWVYRYLTCAWCGNVEHQQISFFEVEQFPSYQVYVCEKCHGYLKTANEKNGTEHGDWVIEDLKTVPLDLVALREGYRRPSGKLLL